MDGGNNCLQFGNQGARGTFWFPKCILCSPPPPQNTFLSPPGRQMYQKTMGSRLVGEVGISFFLCVPLQHNPPPLHSTLISDALPLQWNNRGSLQCLRTLEILVWAPAGSAGDPWNPVQGSPSCAGSLELSPPEGRAPPALSPRGWGLVPRRTPQDPGICLPGLSRCRRPASPTPRAPHRALCAPPPGAAPERHPLPRPPAASASPPAPASRKLPVNSTAFFGRESCRFAASPKGGVDQAERYK